MKIVCLCGSTRFPQAFAVANLSETLAGNIVLSVGSFEHSDDNLFTGMSQHKIAAYKRTLTVVHFEKIRMAHEVFVLNVGGYVGKSSTYEIKLSIRWHKKLRWLCPPDQAWLAGLHEEVAAETHRGADRPWEVVYAEAVHG